MDNRIGQAHKPGKQNMHQHGGNDDTLNGTSSILNRHDKFSEIIDIASK